MLVFHSIDLKLRLEFITYQTPSWQLNLKEVPKMQFGFDISIVVLVLSFFENKELSLLDEAVLRSELTVLSIS